MRQDAAEQRSLTAAGAAATRAGLVLALVGLLALSGCSKTAPAGGEGGQAASGGESGAAGPAESPNQPDAASAAAAAATFPPPGSNALQTATLVLDSSSQMSAVFDEALRGPDSKGLGYARLQVAAAITSRPGSGGTPQLYVGGRVLDFGGRVRDVFEPWSVPLTDLKDSVPGSMESLGGLYRASFQIRAKEDQGKKETEGTEAAATPASPTLPGKAFSEVEISLAVW